jgi:hypothetical protein
MILFGRKHLHISESDQIVDSLFKNSELSYIRLCKIRSGEPTSDED